MKALINLVSNIQSLNKKDFEKYLIIFLIFISLLIGGITYFIYSKSVDLVSHIKKNEKELAHIARIINDNKKIEAQEEHLKKLAEENKNFNIKVFFEEFCKKQNIKPEPGWFENYKSNNIEGNEKFQEDLITATFKSFTMQNLVTILDSLKKEEIIFVKELVIRSEENKKISFDITLGAMKEKGS